MTNKKIKILSEKTRTQFKEIKTQKPEEIEEQEEDFEQDNFDSGFQNADFDDSPKIQSLLPSEARQESLEQELENTPVVSGTSGKKSDDEVYTINAPKYESNYDNVNYEDLEKQEARAMQQERVSLIPKHGESQTTTERNIDVSSWQRGMRDFQERDMQKQQQEYYQSTMKRERQETGLPFEDKKTRRLNI